MADEALEGLNVADAEEVDIHLAVGGHDLAEQPHVDDPLFAARDEDRAVKVEDDFVDSSVMRLEFFQQVPAERLPDVDIARHAPSNKYQVSSCNLGGGQFLQAGNFVQDLLVVYAPQIDKSFLRLAAKHVPIFLTHLKCSSFRKALVLEFLDNAIGVGVNHLNFSVVSRGRDQQLSRGLDNLLQTLQLHLHHNNSKPMKVK